MNTPDDMIIEAFINKFMQGNGSDLFLLAGSQPTVRVNQRLEKIYDKPLTSEDIWAFIKARFSLEVIDEYMSTLEYNTAMTWKDGRLRINLYQQRQSPALVIRKVATSIPTMNELKLPPNYAELAMVRRGLVLVCGPTGSGKSTSLAAMINHRNRNGSGHIITVEDPIEFVHQDINCIVSQRDVGIDTFSFSIGLKNALRQAPDVLLIGEIRDWEIMENAISFAETGHLVLATLHANNSNQAIERILNFFPQEKHRNILQNLALNLRGVVSQRIINTEKDTKALAVEVMLNQGLIRTLIEEGRTRELKDCIENGRDQGMQSFDQSLFDLASAKIISEEIALKEADNKANLQLLFKQGHIRDKMSNMP